MRYKRRTEPVTLTIPAPCSWVRSNQHGHWSVRHKLTRAWRQASAWQARAAGPPPFDGPVAIVATIHKTDRRRFDLDGHTPTVKAAIDGCRDAGLLAEDDTRFVPSLTLRAGEPRPTACLVLTITPAALATDPKEQA